MKTFILDFVSKISSYSKKLDDNSLIINKKWILLNDSDSKIVFIFRENNQLLISENAIIDKSSWDHISKDIFSIEIKNVNYLFTPSFLDENLFILKLDGINEYVILINENRFSGSINSLQSIIDFVNQKYTSNYNIEDEIKFKRSENLNINTIKTVNGISLEIYTKLSTGYTIGDKVYINSKPAPSGKYKIGWLDNLYIKDGEISNL